MAYDASYHWAHPRRWRRWVARLVAVLALGACVAAVYAIVHDGTRPEPPAVADIDPQLRQLAESGGVLAKRLAALRAHSSRTRALEALQEARGDLQAAADELRTRRAAGPVRDGRALVAAVAAHRAYLTAVGRALRHPSPRTGRRLGPRARKARRAWAAVGSADGLPRTIRGWTRLAALARAHGG